MTFFCRSFSRFFVFCTVSKQRRGDISHASETAKKVDHAITLADRDGQKSPSVFSRPGVGCLITVNSPHFSQALNVGSRRSRNDAAPS